MTYHRPLLGEAVNDGVSPFVRLVSGAWRGEPSKRPALIHPCPVRAWPVPLALLPAAVGSRTNQALCQAARHPGQNEETAGGTPEPRSCSVAGSGVQTCCQRQCAVIQGQKDLPWRVSLSPALHGTALRTVPEPPRVGLLIFQVETGPTTQHAEGKDLGPHFRPWKVAVLLSPLHFSSKETPPPTTLFQMKDIPKFP